MIPAAPAILIVVLMMLGLVGGPSASAADAGGAPVGEPGTAGDPAIVLGISGSAGIRFVASCVLVRGGVEETIELQGAVPASRSFVADALRCRIENRSDGGELRAEARKGGGAVSRSSTTGGGAITLSIR